jgi:hypothetical protein
LLCEYYLEISRKANKMIQNQPPIFFHPEINTLYQYGFDIPTAKVRQILALPRHTLIADLEAVVKDSIARQLFFIGTTKDEKTQTFLGHAMMMLGELRAYESLPLLLNVFEQSEEFVEFWLHDDLSSEEYWLPLLWCGHNNIPALVDYIKIDTPAHCAHNLTILEVIEQTAIYYPELASEVKKAILDLFIYAVDKEDTTSNGVTLTTSLLDAIGNLRINEARPYMSKCLSMPLTFYHEEDWEYLVEELNNPLPSPYHRKVPQDLISWYAYIPDRIIQLGNSLRRLREEWPFDEKYGKMPSEEEAMKKKLLKKSEENIN